MNSYQVAPVSYPTSTTTTTQPPRTSAFPPNDQLHSAPTPPPASAQQQQHQQSQSSEQSRQASNPSRPIDNDPPPPRALTAHEQDMIGHLDRLKFFLATAPSYWTSTPQPGSSNPNDPRDRDPTHHHPALNRFLLPSGEYVSCVLWGGLYHITGTDIVRALVFRFEAFARPVRNMKKFEEGVFSDLRNLKPGNDACLEEPKSPFLDLLFKYQCIRTQKKQKVFYWFSVPHDRLFLDALERDLKREKMGLEPTTAVVGEPARSFRYDPKRSLYEQFSKARGGVEGEGDLERVVREADANLADSDSNQLGGQGSASSEDEYTSFDDASQHRKSLGGLKSASGPGVFRGDGVRDGAAAAAVGAAGTSQFYNMFTLFEGSPTYKLRRKKANRASQLGPHSQSQLPEGSMHGTNGSGGSAGDMGYEPEYRDMRRVSPMDELSYGSQQQQMMYSNGYRRDSDFGMSPSSSSPHHQRYAQYPPAMIPAAPLSAPLRSISNLPSQGLGQPLELHQPIPPLVPSIPQVPQMNHSMGGYTSVPPHYSRASTGSSGVSGFVPSPPGRQGGMQVPASAPAHMMQFPHLYEDDLAPHMNGSIASATGHLEQSPLPSPLHHQPMSNGHDGMNLNLAISGTEGASLSKGTKGFVCPLYSCGRHFKRMEHLKRHLRVHTAERPYECTKCHKRFSRSDNLNQHFRTHSRTDGGDSGTGVKAESADEEEGTAMNDAQVTDSETEPNEPSYGEQYPPQQQQQQSSGSIDAQMQMQTSADVAAMYVPPATMQSQHSQHSQDAVSVYEGSVGYDAPFAHAVDEPQPMPFVEMHSPHAQSPFEQHHQQPWTRTHQRSLPAQLEAYQNHHTAVSPAYSVVSNSISSSPPHATVSMRQSVAPSTSLSLNGSPVSRYGSPSEASVIEQRSASVSHMPSNAMYMQTGAASSASALSAPSHKLAFDHSTVPLFNGLNNLASVRRHRSATPVASLSRSMSVGPNAAAEIRRTSWHVVGHSHSHSNHGQGRFHPYSPSQLNAARGYTEEPDTPSTGVPYSGSATEFSHPTVGLSADAVNVGPMPSDAHQLSVEGMLNLQIQQQQQQEEDIVYEQQNVVGGAGGEYVEVVVEEPQMQVAPQQPPQGFQDVVTVNGDMYGMGSHHQPMDQYARPASFAHPQLTL